MERVRAVLFWLFYFFFIPKQTQRVRAFLLLFDRKK